jgi:hypothetical protein
LLDVLAVSRIGWDPTTKKGASLTQMEPTEVALFAEYSPSFCSMIAPSMCTLKIFVMGTSSFFFFVDIVVDVTSVTIGRILFSFQLELPQ